MPSTRNLTDDDYLLLNAAYELRTLLVLVDGIDEAPELKNLVEKTLKLLTTLGNVSSCGGLLLAVGNEFSVVGWAQVSAWSPHRARRVLRRRIGRIPL